jgi:hypothetical protein
MRWAGKLDLKITFVVETAASFATLIDKNVNERFIYFVRQVGNFGSNIKPANIFQEQSFAIELRILGKLVVKIASVISMSSPKSIVGQDLSIVEKSIVSFILISAIDSFVMHHYIWVLVRDEIALIRLILGLLIILDNMALPQMTFHEVKLTD